MLLHQRRQPVEPFTHIRDPSGQIDLGPCRWPDHPLIIRRQPALPSARGHRSAESGALHDSMEQQPQRCVVAILRAKAQVMSQPRPTRADAD
jgi:hypothetical protein